MGLKLFEDFKRHDFASHSVSPKVVEAIKKAERFDITNVAEYYMEGTDQEAWNIYEDFPNLAPPFPVMWMEYRNPERINSEKFGWYPNPDAGGRSAILIEAYDYNQELGESQECRWVLGITGFLSYPDIQRKAVGAAKLRMSITIDHSGKPMISPWPQFEQRSAVHYYGMNDQVMKQLEHATDAVQQLVTNGIWSMTVPALLAICFMHCKNVELIQRDPIAEHKGRRNRQGYHETFKTLEITPMKKILRTEGHSESTGLQRALHICRGHFKDFSKGSGLFGRFHGTYWWGDQLRGHPEVGVVEKDYDINVEKK